MPAIADVHVPSIEQDRLSAFNLLDKMCSVDIPGMSRTPSQRPGKIIARAEGEESDLHRWSTQFVHRFEHPIHRAVTTRHEQTATDIRGKRRAPAKSTVGVDS